MLGSKSRYHSSPSESQELEGYILPWTKCIWLPKSFQDMMGSEPKVLYWKSSLVPKFQYREMHIRPSNNSFDNRRWVANIDKLRYLWQKMHTNLEVNLQLCIYICTTHTNMCICVHTHTHTYIYIHVCDSCSYTFKAYARAHINTCIYMYIYMYTYIHTCI